MTRKTNSSENTNFKRSKTKKKEKKEKAPKIMQFFTYDVIILHVMDCLKRDRDILNFIYSCKLYYQKREKIRFNCLCLDRLSLSPNPPKLFKKVMVQPRFAFDLQDIDSLSLEIFINCYSPTPVVFNKFHPSLTTLRLIGVNNSLYPSHQNKTEVKFNHSLNSTKLIKLDIYHHGKVSIASFPKSFKSLEIMSHESSYKNVIPNDIEDLVLSSTEELDYLPNTLKSLSIYHYQFNINSIIPQTVTKLDLGESFSHQFSCLPPNLTWIRFSKKFTTEILPGYFPKTLKTILNLSISHEIFEDVWPPALEELGIGHIESHLSVPVWPATLTKFHYHFDRKIEPSSFSKCSMIKEFYLDNSFDNAITPGDLPAGIELLDTSFKGDTDYSNVYQIKISTGPDQLKIFPESLKTLDLTGCMVGSVDFSNLVNLEVLKLANAKDLNLLLLPKNLKVLKLPSNFNEIIRKGFLPNSITHLEFGDKMCQELKIGSLSSSLEYLYFPAHSEFNSEIKPGVLPSKLKIFHLGHIYSQPFKPESLPESLRELYLGAYKHPFPAKVLPEKLEILDLTVPYKQSIIKSQNTLVTFSKRQVFEKPFSLRSKSERSLL